MEGRREKLEKDKKIKKADEKGGVRGRGEREGNGREKDKRRKKCL